MVFTVFMIVPIVAPSVGQALLLTGTWQLIFVFMGVIGLIFGLWAFLRLRESLPVAARRPFSFGSVAEGFGIVFSSRMALFYGLAGMFMFGGILGFVNSAQQIYVGIYGLGALFPFVFAATPLTFALAFFLNSRLVSRFGMRRLAHGAMLAFLVVTGTWLVLSLTGFMPLWLFVLMMMLTGAYAGAGLGQRRRAQHGAARRGRRHCFGGVRRVLHGRRCAPRLRRGAVLRRHGDAGDRGVLRVRALHRRMLLSSPKAASCCRTTRQHAAQ